MIVVTGVMIIHTMMIEINKSSKMKFIIRIDMYLNGGNRSE